RNFPSGHADDPIADGASNEDTQNTPSTGLSASMAIVSAAEQQKDHMGAVKILKEMLTENLEDAAVHHRLAVNLMAAGRISEAVTEFRIASALKPSEKAFAEDLAKAMSVNKRALSVSPAGMTGSASNSQTAQQAVGGAQ
ncbi:MAG: tetratricopeptide repeat protein, partial [Candidatus Obscuribacterales bacterium]|nr:tetratricopeptide repeat protein [Candidatus Obscuribacterales bacterium]